MKKLLSIIIIIIAMFASQALAAEQAILKTTLLRYDPTPAQPGEYINVYVQIENTGDAEAKNGYIEFVESFPFTIEKGDKDSEKIGKLVAGQTYVTDFKMRVSENAIEGSNDLKFKITDDVSLDKLTKRVFSVNILTQDSDVDITNILVEPKEMEPGQSGNIKITLKNTADSTIEDISLTLRVINTVGSTIVDLPFAIEDSVSKKTKDRLHSGQEVVFDYNIISYPTVAPGIYKIPILVEFYDGTGQNFSKPDLITVIVNPKVDVYASIERSDLSKNQKIGEVVFRIVNKGFGDIQFTNLKIRESDDFKILSPFKEVYIGNIDSDDFETAEFDIIANEDELTIPITIDYKDSLNKQYSTQKDLVLKLYSNEELGVVKSNNSQRIIIAVVIILIAFWLFKKRKNRK